MGFHTFFKAPPHFLGFALYVFGNKKFQVTFLKTGSEKKEEDKVARTPKTQRKIEKCDKMFFLNIRNPS